MKVNDSELVTRPFNNNIGVQDAIGVNGLLKNETLYKTLEGSKTIQNSPYLTERGVF